MHREIRSPVHPRREFLPEVQVETVSTKINDAMLSRLEDRQQPRQASIDKQIVVSEDQDIFTPSQVERLGDVGVRSNVRSIPNRADRKARALGGAHDQSSVVVARVVADENFQTISYRRLLLRAGADRASALSMHCGSRSESQSSTKAVALNVLVLAPDAARRPPVAGPTFSKFSSNPKRQESKDQS